MAISSSQTPWGMRGRGWKALGQHGQHTLLLSLLPNAAFSGLQAEDSSGNHQLSQWMRTRGTACLMGGGGSGQRSDDERGSDGGHFQRLFLQKVTAKRKLEDDDFFGEAYQQPREPWHSVLPRCAPPATLTSKEETQKSTVRTQAAPEPGSWHSLFHLRNANKKIPPAF